MPSTRLRWSPRARCRRASCSRRRSNASSAIDPALNAVVIRWFDHARDTAANDLPDGPFRGVPFLLKDLYARVRRAADQQRQRRIQGGARRLRRRHHARRPVPCRRPRHRRSNEQPRARQRPDHRAGRVGRDPQPVGSHPHTGRFQRRRRGGRRLGDGAVRACQRRRRLDPHPRLLLWAGRSEAEPGPHHARPDPRRERPRRSSTASAARSATPPRSSTRPMDPESATRSSLRRRRGRTSRSSARTRAGCASASSTTIHRAERCDAECADSRPERSAALLESLGHTVEPAWPKVLEDTDFRCLVRCAVEHQHGSVAAPIRSHSSAARSKTASSSR